MKITKLQETTKVAINGGEIGQKEKQAINAAMAFLKGKIPEIVPMLTNPNTQTFLTKFFDLVAADPAVLNGLKNAMQTISSSMQADAAGTSTAIGSASTRA